MRTDRAGRRTRRLVLERKRRRVAECPRVGDTLYGSDGQGQRWRTVVERVTWEQWHGGCYVLAVRTFYDRWQLLVPNGISATQFAGVNGRWADQVRRAQMVQEGPV